MSLKAELLDILRMLEDAQFEYSKEKDFSQKGNEFLTQATRDLRKIVIDFNKRREEGTMKKFLCIIKEPSNGTLLNSQNKQS